jgi:hypothetical protein
MVAITESAVKELLDPDSFFLSTCIALSFYLEMRSYNTCSNITARHQP